MIVRKILSCAALLSALLVNGVCAAQDALSLVPSDAEVLFRIEAGRILEKMGGEEFISVVMASDDPQAEEFSIEEWGVALDKPVYMALRRNESYVVAMSLSDADDFARTVQKKCNGKLHSRKGVSWIEDSDLCFIFDSGRAVAVSADRETDIGYWRSRLASDDGRVKGLPANGLRRLEESDADMFFMASGKFIDDDELARVKDIYGDDIPAEDLTFVWSLDGDDGAARMHYGVVAESDAAAEYLNKNMIGVKRVEGRYADCIPASSLFILYNAIDGEALAEAIARLQLFDEDDTDKTEILRLVASISGDMAVVLDAPAIDGSSATIPATVMARVKNRAIMDFVVRKLGDDTAVEETDDGYVIDAGGTNIIMSERNGDMVVTTVESMTSLPRAAEPTALKGCREGYGGFYLDVKSILASAGPFIGLLDGGDSAVSLLSRIECVEGYAERPDSFICTVRLSDERDNIYRILADAIVTFEMEDDDAAAAEE